MEFDNNIEAIRQQIDNLKIKINENIINPNFNNEIRKAMEE